MNNMVLSRAKRTLSSVLQFNLQAKIDENLYGLRIPSNENLVGVYKNDPENSDATIAITDLGLHIFINGEWHFIDFAHVADVRAPENKDSVAGLDILLISGDVFFLPVRGGNGKFKDAFPFLRFLHRVIKDIQSDPERLSQ